MYYMATCIIWLQGEFFGQKAGFLHLQNFLHAIQTTAPSELFVVFYCYESFYMSYVTRRDCTCFLGTKTTRKRFIGIQKTSYRFLMATRPFTILQSYATFYRDSLSGRPSQGFLFLISYESFYMSYVARIAFAVSRMTKRLEEVLLSLKI